MDFPANDVKLVPEKTEKEGCPTLRSDLAEAEIVQNIAQVFLPRLATACVDNTTGDVFRSPASIAVDKRKEMVDYLMQRN